MKKTIIFLTIVLITIISCKHWDCPEGKRNYPPPFDDIIVSYFGNFRNGDYWVYKDSLTNKIDTLYLSEYHSIIAPGAPGDCDYHDMFKCDIKNNSNIKIYVEILMRSSGKVISDISCTNSGDRIFMPINYDNKNFNSYHENIKIISNLNILGINYKNVLPLQDYEKEMFMYFSPNIGLIKIKYNCSYDNRKSYNYKLLSYKLNK